MGGDLEANIQLGVATSGYYVREAKSPTLAELAGFVETRHSGYERNGNPQAKLGLGRIGERK